MTGTAEPEWTFSPLARPLESAPAFTRYGSAGDLRAPLSPIVISVPHAGRDYPAWLLAQARVPAAVLRRLEDRYADLLVHGLIERGCEVLVARAPRALIDLNRDEREIDPVMVRDLPYGAGLYQSAKLRGGLGLFPRRLHGANDLWRQPFDWTELQGRIAQVHRPYHAALEAMMQRARDAYGYAILLDIHSMPPLPPTAEQGSPQVVLGDGFGRSASGRLIMRAEAVIRARGMTVAQNHPYPGNYLIARHGRPEKNFHALQVEIDRSLYLDSSLDRACDGASAIQALLVELTATLADEWQAPAFAQAAE
ncbi:MAG: N-formylglutamate amidohydrolase [Sphingobium sp.]|uniref:N-formylglutamate amidohydrolase n=1 Tax=Sphingobium sp. TaxID=1912891 RepID=UPI0029A093EC|nr:N-formylglutamate amidohydrolase [Sphingobium sp.]MDX3911260.1 N-formylglutamate amidohydrolase [Sphingobium sp.]